MPFNPFTLLSATHFLILYDSFFKKRPILWIAQPSQRPHLGTHWGCTNTAVVTLGLTSAAWIEISSCFILWRGPFLLTYCVIYSLPLADDGGREPYCTATTVAMYSMLRELMDAEKTCSESSLLAFHFANRQLQKPYLTGTRWQTQETLKRSLSRSCFVESVKKKVPSDPKKDFPNDLSRPCDLIVSD